MSRIVLDASAILAVLNREPGADRLSPQLLSTAVASTVNLAEVQSKLVHWGISLDEAWAATLCTTREAIAFSSGQAKIAGDLIAETRPLGLSLADRACLALGLDLNAPVYTADRSWKSLRLGVRVHCIR